MFILTALDLVAGRITAGKVKDGVFRQQSFCVFELVELVGDFCIVAAGVARVLKKQLRNIKLINKLTEGQSSFPVGCGYDIWYDRLPHLSSFVTLSALVVVIVVVMLVGIGASVGSGGSDGTGSCARAPAKVSAKNFIWI